MIHIHEVQRRAWANKVAKGLSGSAERSPDVPYEFALAYGELAEAFDAYRKNPEALEGELADVMIYLCGIASMCHIDLSEAVEHKLDVNEARNYRQNSHGNLVKE